MKRGIKQIIAQEITNSKIDNWHGINKDNLADHLIEPTEEEYIENDSPVLLWTVLKESPDTQEGYLIYFDPEVKKFGLGVYDKQKNKVAIGIYGSFINTVNAM